MKNLIVKKSCLFNVIGILSIIFICIDASPSKSRQSNIDILIESPISEKYFNKYQYLIRSISVDLDRKDALIYESDQYDVIRIENPQFCEFEFCLTFVVNRCDREICPNTSVMVVNRFKRFLLPTTRLGEVIIFTTRRPDISTTVLINERFVAASQGI